MKRTTKKKKKRILPLPLLLLLLLLLLLTNPLPVISIFPLSPSPHFPLAFPQSYTRKNKIKRKLQKETTAHLRLTAAEIASRPSKKRKLALPKKAENDVQEISDEDEAGAAVGADGAEEEEEDGEEEEEEEEDYESENGGEEAVDLLPTGKKDGAKSNLKAPLKSAELVGNDDDDDE